MKISAALITMFAAIAVAAPAGPHQKRAAMLTTKAYDEISISGGSAGNAKQKALDVFSALNLTNMAAVDLADIDFLGSVNDIDNDAEVAAFNPAISAIAGEEEVALQNGKIKNKVLKLTAASLELQIRAAQREDISAKLRTETKKLNNNRAKD